MRAKAKGSSGVKALFAFGGLSGCLEGSGGLFCKV